MNVLPFEKRIARIEEKAKHSGGEPPYDAGMEARLAKIETIIPTLATKEDLARAEGGIRSDMHKEFNAQTWRIIGAMLTFGTALTAATYFIARNIH